MPTTRENTMETLADDKTISLYLVSDDIAITSSNLRDRLNQIGRWLKGWKTEANESESSQKRFTLRRDKYPAVNFNQIEVPRQNVLKYLDLDNTPDSFGRNTY